MAPIRAKMQKPHFRGVFQRPHFQYDPLIFAKFQFWKFWTKNHVFFNFFRNFKKAISNLVTPDDKSLNANLGFFSKWRFRQNRQNGFQDRDDTLTTFAVLEKSWKFFKIRKKHVFLTFWAKFARNEPVG